MPERVWDTDAELSEWTLTNLEVSGGLWQLSAGATDGQAVSPVFYAQDFLRPSMLTVEEITRPTGCNVYVYFRSGQTQAECEGADWQGPVDVVDDQGIIRVDLRTWYLNNDTAPLGAYWQIKLVLEAE